MGYKSQSRAFITISLAKEEKWKQFYRILGVALPHALLLFIQQSHHFDAQSSTTPTRWFWFFQFIFRLLRECCWSSDLLAVCVCVLFFFFGKHNELAVEFIVSARTREKAWTSHPFRIDSIHITRRSALRPIHMSVQHFGASLRVIRSIVNCQKWRHSVTEFSCRLCCWKVGFRTFMVETWPRVSVFRRKCSSVSHHHANCSQRMVPTAHWFEHKMKIQEEEMICIRF